MNHGLRICPPTALKLLKLLRPRRLSPLSSNAHMYLWEGGSGEAAEKLERVINFFS